MSAAPQRDSASWFGPALTPWGRAVAVIAAMALAASLGTTASPYTPLILAALLAVLVADLVVGAAGLRARVVHVSVPTVVRVGTVATTHVLVEAAPGTFVTIPHLGERPVRLGADGWATLEAVLPEPWVHRIFVTQALRFGPLGMTLWTRRMVSAIPAMAVVPAPEPTTVPAVVGSDEQRTESATMGNRGGEAVRQVREHQAGDGFRSIHWPSTARRGELVTALRDSPQAPRVTMTVVAGATPTERTAAIAHGMFVGSELLRRGHALTVVTASASGFLTPSRLPYGKPNARATAPETAVEPVDDAVELARAIACATPVEPVVDGAVMRVDHHGARWVDE